MSKQEWEKFVKTFNENFDGEPFLPDGFASAKMHKDGIVFKIGGRDLLIGFNGACLKSGSLIGPADPWSIAKRKPVGKKN